MPTHTPAPKPPATATAAAPVWRGVEVTAGLAELELLALLKKIGPGGPGWQALLTRIPGHRSADWQSLNTHAAIANAVRNALSVEAFCHVFLLSDDSVVALVREADALLLPGLEQALAKVLQKADGRMEVRRFVPGQESQELSVLVQQKHAITLQARAAAEWRKQQEQLDALRFSVNEHDIRLRPARQQKIVLLVEDDPSTLMLLTGLMDPSVAVVAAQNASEAVEKYRTHLPDMVFLDIGLPDVDGLTVLANITAADPGARVVMLTANAYRNNLDKARASGVRGFLAKPFTRDKIQRTLESLLQLKAI